MGQIVWRRGCKNEEHFFILKVVICFVHVQNMDLESVQLSPSESRRSAFQRKRFLPFGSRALIQVPKIVPGQEDWLKTMYSVKSTPSQEGQSFEHNIFVKSLSRVWLFAIPWTAVYQASLSLGFSRQEYWSGLPFPSPGDLPDPWIEPRSPAFQADALPSEPPGKHSYSIFLYISKWSSWCLVAIVTIWRYC